MGRPNWMIVFIKTYGFAFRNETKKQLVYRNGEELILLPKGKTKLHESFVRDILKSRIRLSGVKIAEFVDKNRQNIHS